MTNGERLAFYRKKNAMTQQQLGEQLNVSAQAVSKWENDQSEPDIATFCKLAEIYQISVNELVGAEEKQQSAPKQQESTTVVAPVVMPVIVAEQKKQKKPNPVAVFLKKRWLILLIAAISLVAMAVLTVAIVIVVQKTEPSRMLKKYEQIKIGMTKEEILEIMGEPDESHKPESSGDALLDALLVTEYGYMEGEYWYYRDSQYDKMEKASEKAKEELDLGFESTPWTQIRLTFSKGGALIEAYYNAAYDSGLWNDYGTGEKEILSMEFVGDAPIIEHGGIPSELKPYAKIAFKDGSYYRGEIVFKSNAQKINGSDPAQGIVKYEHPWGEGEAILMWQ